MTNDCGILLVRSFLYPHETKYDARPIRKKGADAKRVSHQEHEQEYQKRKAKNGAEQSGGKKSGTKA